MGFKLDYRFFFLKFNKKPQDFKNDEKLCFLTLKFSHNQRRDQIEIDIVDDVYEEDNDSYDDESILIQKEPDVHLAPAPPLILRQQQEQRKAPLILRERPPIQHRQQRIITIPGRVLPPPPRQVIIERIPPPRDIIIERWLDYPNPNREKHQQHHRRIIHEQIESEPVIHDVDNRNYIIDWIIDNDNGNETEQNEPQININYLGVETMNPDEKHLEDNDEEEVILLDSFEMTELTRSLNLKVPEGEMLAVDGRMAAKNKSGYVDDKEVNEFIWSGDLDALKYLNLK